MEPTGSHDLRIGQSACWIGLTGMMRFDAPTGTGLARPPAPRWGRRLRWWGTAGVAAAFVAMAFVLPAIDGALPSERPIAAGTVFDVDGFTFVPTPGWSLDIDQSVVIGAGGRIELSSGAVGFRATTDFGTGDARTGIERAAEQLSRDEPLVAVAEPRAIATVSGLDGVQRLYGTATAEVLITAVQSPGSTAPVLILVAAGPPGSLRGDVELEISAMIDSVTSTSVRPS